MWCLHSSSLRKQRGQRGRACLSCFCSFSFRSKLLPVFNFHLLWQTIMKGATLKNDPSCQRQGLVRLLIRYHARRKVPAWHACHTVIYLQNMHPQDRDSEPDSSQQPTKPVVILAKHPDRVSCHKASLTSLLAYPNYYSLHRQTINDMYTIVSSALTCHGI